MNARRGVLLLAAVLFLANLWGYDLWAPDEPYFGEGAREMVADGQWLVPHVNGRVTLDKPPLFFWLIALLSLPLGDVVSFTARLPSALAALGTVALTMRHAERLTGPRTGALAGLVLTTSYLFLDKARSAQIDALLCLLILVAVWAFEGFRSGRIGARRAGLSFWLACALAVLAKGPVGVVLPLGIAFVTLATDGDLRAWRRFAPLAGPLLFLGLIGLWIATATVAGRGEYSVWEALREHVFARSVHGLHHRQPPWYYLEVLPVQLLPWTGLLPGALLLAWRNRRLSGERLLLTHAAFVVLFFSIPVEKRDLYVLPAYPAFAVLVAMLVASFSGWNEPAGSTPRSRVGRGWLTIGLGATGVLLALAGIALPLAGQRLGPVSLPAAWALGAVLVAGGSAILWTSRRDRPLLSVLLAAQTVGAAWLLTAFLVLPRLDPVKSAREFALEIERVTADSRQAGHSILAWRLRNQPEAFAFYSGGVYFAESWEPGDLVRHLSSGPGVFAVADGDDLDLLPSELRERIVVVARRTLSRKNVVLITMR